MRIQDHRQCLPAAPNRQQQTHGRHPVTASGMVHFHPYEVVHVRLYADSSIIARRKRTVLVLPRRTICCSFGPSWSVNLRTRTGSATTPPAVGRTSPRIQPPEPPPRRTYVVRALVSRRPHLRARRPVAPRPLLHGSLAPRPGDRHARRHGGRRHRAMLGHHRACPPGCRLSPPARRKTNGLPLT